MPHIYIHSESVLLCVLNIEMIELIIFKLKHQSKVSDKIQLQVIEKVDHVVPSIKNLGVYFDALLTVNRQVNAISSPY